MKLCETLEKLQATMPPIFVGSALDEFTGRGYRWRTLQNEKSRGVAPRAMFLKAGTRKLLLDRDKFLAYWQNKLDLANAAEGLPK